MIRVTFLPTQKMVEGVPVNEVDQSECGRLVSLDYKYVSNEVAATVSINETEDGSMRIRHGKDIYLTTSHIQINLI